MYSLEDDDYGDMFITQSSKEYDYSDKSEVVSMEGDENLFLGVNTTDFTSPCKSVLDNGKQDSMYSDISDFEENDKNMENKNEPMR